MTLLFFLKPARQAYGITLNMPGSAGGAGNRRGGQAGIKNVPESESKTLGFRGFARVKVSQLREITPKKIKRPKLPPKEVLDYRIKSGIIGIAPPEKPQIPERKALNITNFESDAVLELEALNTPPEAPKDLGILELADFLKEQNDIRLEKLKALKRNVEAKREALSGLKRAIQQKLEEEKHFKTLLEEDEFLLTYMIGDIDDN